MNNDITELTAKLKAAAIYEQLHTFMAVKPGEILALTEALEAAEKRIAELSHDLEKQLSKFQEMRDAEHDVSRRYVIIRHILGTDSLAYGENHFEATEAAAKRAIDSLKCSALTVKLPDVEKWRSVEAVRAQSAYKILAGKAITEAGGKLQIEGE